MKDTQRKPSDKLADAFAKFPAPTAADAEGLCKALIAGGPGVIDELVTLVGQEFGDAEGVKAKYTLHAVSVFSARPGAEADRAMAAGALAKHLSKKHSAELKAFVLRHLQYCGRADEVAAMSPLLADERLCEPTAQALAAIGGAKAAAALRAALGSAKGKRTATIIMALGWLGDAGEAETVRTMAKTPDRNVHLAALYALANAGDAAAANLCLSSAAGHASFNRTQATDACILLARRLAEAGKAREAAGILNRLLDLRKDPQDVHERCAILQTLAETSPVGTVGAVVAALRSKDARCRIPAARTAVDLARTLRAKSPSDAKRLLDAAVKATTEGRVVQQAQALRTEMGT